ncbi:MAG: hypothetical protein PQJ44_06895 [Sphaerochaetaceae bacterium]|nr:hypothetical protein [Sphaerochaetaceae bacterium]
MKLFTEDGREHGLLKTLANSVTKDNAEGIKNKKEYEAKKKENSRMVNARYVNSRGVGEPLSLPYCAGAGEPIHLYKFIHNYTYRVPMGVVNQINENAKLVQRKKISEENDSASALSNGGSLQVHEMIPVGFE